MTSQDNTRHGRGELRIYLGAAPGVGKTYAMLGEAHRRAERGTDVVVGVVDTHGRARTAALLDGLEVLACERTSHGDQQQPGELDVAAVLARRPDVVLVDELAHANPPGSKHASRWQDVERILAAGITVLSTVNVQHIASMADVARRITGVDQHETVPDSVTVPDSETVPDSVVRRADQIELVDMTPEALRRRLAHGNVYPADRIDAALGNYFRPGNLTALRELALLWLADQVDVSLRRYREENQITDIWETRERVVVAITGGQESETLIRRARRLSSRAGADLLAVHVLRGGVEFAGPDQQTGGVEFAGPDQQTGGVADASPETIARYRKLAEELGATFHTVIGDDVPAALLDFARAVNATQLVLGTSRRSHWARLFDEGIGATVLRQSGAIDVHLVTHHHAGGHAPRRPHGALSVRRRTLGWALAVLLPALVTGIGGLLAEHVNVSTDVAVYVLATVAVALVGGLGPALASAVLGGMTLNFFFVTPRYTFTVASGDDIAMLIIMVLVAVLVALVVDRSARLATQAVRARTEAALLVSYARTVLTHPRPLSRLLAVVRENFGLESVALLERADGGWLRLAHAGHSPCDLPDSADVDVAVTDDVHLALRGRALPAHHRRAVEGAAGQALLALRQQRMAAEAAQAHQMAQTSAQRTALLSAVGHDLRTPLTSIKAAVGSLRDSHLRLSKTDTDELLATVEESADRLKALVDNLLDSSRLATGAVAPTLKPVGFDEIVARALAGIDDHGSVLVAVDESLPMVLADIGLAERVLANVIDNALRHGRTRPGAEPVSVRGSAYEGRVELRVIDHGRGLPKGTADKAFAPFQRLSDRAAGSGVGLGMSVAKGFTEAMGGTITAEDTPGGGLTVVMSLPACRSTAQPRLAVRS